MPGKGKGMLIRDVSNALGYPYVQANTPWTIYRLVLDIDRDISLTAAQGTWHDDYVMPDPSWFALNPENGHAHIGYEIAVPVARHDTARRQPLKLLAAIEHALTIKIAADRGYVGLVCKNPLHPAWHARVVRAHPYDLTELSSWVDLAPYSGRRPAIVADGPLGRNCAVFDGLRTWAYRAIRQYKAGSRDAWNAAVLSHAEGLNSYMPPLPNSEVRATARSVAKFCWQTFDIESSDARFSKRQAHLGQRGGYASGAARFNASLDTRLEAAQLRAEGRTYADIAGTLGVHVNTVSAWLKQPTLKP